MIQPSLQMASLHHLHHSYSSSNSNSTSTHPSAGIQPSVKTILDLAWDSHQHIVRLYYLPTPNTNGFTTTHTLVYQHEQAHPAFPSRASRRSTVSGMSVHSSTGSGSPQRSATAVNGGQPPALSENNAPHRVCHLTRISESERGIVHLARLRITSMIIATSSIPYLSHLVSLRLQGNQLTDLPLQIFRLPSLRELDVSQNRLTEISGLIGLLAPTLEELFLQSNQLQSLPQQLGRLKRLRLLDIADNHLGCIPVEVQRLVSESFASERQGPWRVSEASPPTQSPTDLFPMGVGSGSGPVNIVPNHEGGHDDDDYVQIRQGMKCWARGNRFWHVGVPWPSASASSTAVSTPYSQAVRLPSSAAMPALLSTSSSSSSLSSASSSTPAPSPFSYSGTPASALPLPALNIISPPPSNIPTGSHSDAQSLYGIRSQAATQQTHEHRSSTLSRYQRHFPGSPPHPGQLVDRRGYSKDSYTSCPWTLSLADICSQIVGEKLQEDTHYFCHTSTCVAKRTSNSKNLQAPPHQAARDMASVSVSGEDMDGCAVMMMPDWTIEQLGLHRLSELRNTLCGVDNTEEDEWAYGEGMGSIGPDGVFTGQPNSHDDTNNGQYHALHQQPVPMQLTLDEMEMGCETCSVCHRRLYFPGLRWKGVGVMDERIVPLEWVACSVQCRARAEYEERRGSSSGGRINTSDLAPSVGMEGRESLSRASNGSQSDFGGVETTASWSPGPLTPRQFESGLSTRNSPAPAVAAATAGAGGVSAGTGMGVSPAAFVNLARETTMYGLNKYRALRRRTRSLSL
ncbi:hypothetical protein EC968_010197 [Mortierella alpina]|nr:hypothetical protein EC968_010197 [Mortierella alpina]